MKDWSDSKKWWMDLVKSIISISVGIFLTVSVVAHFEEQRRRDAAYQVLASTAIQDFSKAARLYGLLASDAFRDKIRGLPREESEATRIWQDNGYDNLIVTQRSIEQLFQETDPKLLVDFTNAYQKVFCAFNAAPLFPMGEMACDDKKDVDDAWKRHKVKPKILGKYETNDVWERYKVSCFNKVMKNYEQATDAVVNRMYRLVREAKPKQLIQRTAFSRW